jgi:sterol desaturase/sphingolipid hydroxylase (fatty acid hydroxylase superfamily)
MLVFLIVLGAGLLMAAVELLRPGRNWPRVRGWWWRAVAVNGIEVGSVFAAGLLWDRCFSQWRPWSADALGTTGGAIVGYLVITFVYYWWHRWRHEVPFFWRWFHQLHHSPQRIEVITSFYKHPLEIIANSVISSAIVYLIVGLGPGAGAGAVMLTGLAELFYHWNVKTPRWLGYIIQRPESHCVHHQEGIHHYNFSDLPLWDMLFGTFYNPRTFEDRCGFGDGETRVAEMLGGVDVTGVGATSAAPMPVVAHARVRRSAHGQG